MRLHFHSETPFQLKILSQSGFIVETPIEEERKGYHFTILANSTDDLDIEIQPQEQADAEKK